MDAALSCGRYLNFARFLFAADKTSTTSYLYVCRLPPKGAKRRCKSTNFFWIGQICFIGGIVFFCIFAVGFGRPGGAPRGNQVRILSSPAAVSLNRLHIHQATMHRDRCTGRRVCGGEPEDLPRPKNHRSPRGKDLNEHRIVLYRIVYCLASTTDAYPAFIRAFPADFSHCPNDSHSCGNTTVATGTRHSAQPWHRGSEFPACPLNTAHSRPHAGL